MQFRSDEGNVKRLRYTTRLLEASRGDLKQPEYLALNPRGKVPTLKDGEFVLYESLAIMEYLEREHPEYPIFGRTPREAALICIAALLHAASKEEAKSFALGLLPLQGRYPKLADWMQRVEALPGYERTYPPHWRQ